MENPQLSIYDFLPKEKSQEVAPSETHPQVDEAQVDIYGAMAQQLAEDVECMVLGDIPSSALDTEKLISENLVFNPEGYAEKVVGLPTEDTDSTLFSVGDTVKVINPYHYDYEDWDYLEEWKDKVGTILKKGFKGYVVFIDDIENYFYPLELIKI